MHAFTLGKFAVWSSNLHACSLDHAIEALQASLSNTYPRAYAVIIVDVS